jgi:hypothetical protein
MNATVEKKKLKNCPFGANTTAGIKNMATISDSTGTLVSSNTTRWATLVTAATVQCASDCASVEVWYVHVTLALFKANVELLLL